MPMKTKQYRGFGKSPTTRTWHLWSRANIACKLALGDIPKPLNSDNNPAACEVAVIIYLRSIVNPRSTHPLKKRYDTFERVSEWFNATYPPKSADV